MTMPDVEVAVVGGGPVGMGVAIELGQRGVRCAVVERYRQPQPIPKGQNLTQRTMEHFQGWGVEAAVRAARTIPPEWGAGGLTAYRTLLGPYHYDWMQRELVRPYYATDNERLPQYATEAVLRRRASELPSVEVLAGWTGETVRQDDAGVQVGIVERDGGAHRFVQAKYVVGCDGARSMVREAAGIIQTLSDHDRVMVLLVFHSRGLHEKLARYPRKSFFSVLDPALDGYWKFFGRVDLGNQWFFHAPVPPGTTADNYDFRALLFEAAGEEFDVSFDHIGFWDLRVAVADTYRRGRAFVAGDAAHSHPPYAGYGINTGLEDARNLGWKLAAVLQGWGGEALLDSYSAERQPVFVSTGRDFIEKAIGADRRFLRAFDPARDRAAFEAEWAARSSGARSEVASFEPNYEGSPVVAGPPGGVCSAVGSHAFAARPGHHLAPQNLSCGRAMFEALGPGFALLALDAEGPRLQAFEQAARSLGLPLRVMTDTRAEGRDLYEADLVLIRPDNFVAWTSSGDPDPDPATLLRRAAGLG